MPGSEPSLAAIYAKIPDAGCKGLCVENCGPILCSDHERAEIRKWTGEDIMGWTESPMETVFIRPCRFLLDGKCSIYSMRPAICRLFGSVEDRMLRCKHGCKPARLLSNAESRAILKECDDAR